MAETTIEWTRGPGGEKGYSFNFWIGCTEISKAETGGGGCDNCYARMSTPVRVLRSKGIETWGSGAKRWLTSEANRRHPIQWNTLAKKKGIRAKVFCSSLSDVFDNEVPIEWFLELLELIDATPYLDWLLLTKRIGNAVKRLTEALQATQSVYMRGYIERWLAGNPPVNVSLGATVVNQPEATRDIPKLQATPAVVRFLSIEPLLGEVNLPGLDGIHWVIVGGESGPKARPMHPKWVKGLRDQCEAAGVKFFFKQWGTWANSEEAGLDLNLCYEKSETGGWVELDGSYSEGENAAPRSAKAVHVFKLKKQISGRLLDGRTWDAVPEG